MHINSLQAYYEEKTKLSRRSRDILSHLEKFRGPFTDRQIMERMGFSEPNAVRPRITELIEKGFLEECGKVECMITHKNVRTVRIKPRIRPEQNETQQEMEL